MSDAHTTALARSRSMPTALSSAQVERAAYSFAFRLLSPCSAPDDRLFHLDLPLDSAGFRGAPRTSAQLARAQHLRDRTSHGRDYDVVSSVATSVLPPSIQAQNQLKLSGPNAVGRDRMDQRIASQRAGTGAGETQQSQQQQQLQDQLQ